MLNEKTPKVIAMYLPQYHETEDNNAWWGKGFTDWESVRRAEKCFEGHRAPWAPLNENYYDLSDVGSLRWQAELAKKYGVNGFCFYHYYFKDGKKELEKPAELLLQHKDIDLHFCFNWANESWIRSWSKISGNIWSEKFESTEQQNKTGILVEQDYGDEAAWKKHFEYLLPFFKDSRYIRIDDKPVFIFYRPLAVKCLDAMVRTWRELAEKEGLKGLYLVSVNANAAMMGMDASLLYEPRSAIDDLNSNGMVTDQEGVRCFDYQKIWDSILSEEGYQGTTTYFTGLSGYDDTPRRGKSAECIINNTPELFGKNMKRLLHKSIQYNNELVFINAWNEWGEGMYLEPDEEYGHRYLEALAEAKGQVAESKEEFIETLPPANKEGIDKEKLALAYDVNKFRMFLELFDKWLYMERLSRFTIDSLLKDKGVSTVSIYGLGLLGKQLYNQLENTEITVEYGIDRYVGQYGKNLKIHRPEEANWPSVDAIIVTAYEEEKVETFIKNKSKARVFRLSQLIEEMWRKI